MMGVFVMRLVVSGLAWWAMGVALCGGAGALQPLAAREDNDILTTEEQLRVATNTLFSLLRLRGAKHRPRLQQYSLVHNYFITLTLQDYNALRVIAKATRVDNTENNNNIISTFIALLNEILDDENLGNLLVEVKKSYDLDDEINELMFLKHHYIDPVYTMNINKDVLKLLEDDGPPDKTASIKTNGTLSLDKLIDIDSEMLRIMHDDYFVFNNVSDTTEGDLVENINVSNKDVVDDGIWRETDMLPTRRIFGGQKTKIHHYPFMVTVQMFNKFQCGGSIIKDDLVITAASCLQLAWNNRFYRENPAFLSVRIGSSFYESGGEVVPILEVYFYPSYDPQTLHHNIAVMRMFRRIRWHRRVKKIPLDQLESPLPFNTDGIMVLGWGSQLSSNVILNPMVNKMKYSVLDYYPLEECQVIYSKKYVTKKHFCAGFMSVGGGACNRDVGGPGVVSGYLTGIISFGTPVCGRPDSPTVFTKVGYYYDWIEEIMDQDVPNIKSRTTLLTDRPMSFMDRGFTTLPWTVTPIMKSKKTTAYTTTTGPEQDVINNNDRVGFKDFLKTMFNSKEIEDYFDSIRKQPKKSAMQNNNGDKKLSSRHRLRMNKLETTTESSDGEESIMTTQLVFDPTWTTSPISDSDKDDDTDDINDFDLDEDGNDDDYDTLSLPKDSDMTTSPDLEMFEMVDQDSVDEDKELEGRILKLVSEAEISPLTKPTPTYPKKNGKHNERTEKEKIDKMIMAMLYGGSSETDKTSTTTAKPDIKKHIVEPNIENNVIREIENSPVEKSKESEEINITLENLKQDRKRKKKRQSKKKASEDGGSETFSRDGIIEAFNRDGADKHQYNLSESQFNDTEMNDGDNDTVKDVGLDDFLSGNILFEIFQDAIAEINSTLNTSD